MEDKLIAFQTAKLAKQKGFNIKCKNWYDQTETLNPVKGIRGAVVYTNEGYAPTQTILKDWLREVHNIHIEVYLANFNGKYAKHYRVEVYNLMDHEDYQMRNVTMTTTANTYTLALEDGLLRALTLIELPLS